MALILSIERFSINDGPGIRSTVFLKGCPVNCLWCHNPESKNFYKQLSYNKENCINCKRCVDVCPTLTHYFKKNDHLIDFNKCIGCGNCVESCRYSALKIYGSEMTVKEVYDILIRDKVYYDTSCGGVTISGGEPLVHIDFILELFILLKALGIHTCIETSGFVNTKNMKIIAPYTDLFLYDIKADHLKYEKLTGVSKKIILKNLKILHRNTAKIILRCPMVPGINDTPLHFDELIELCKNDSVVGIEILPYHDTGKGKYAQIGETYHLTADIPDSNMIDNWYSKIEVTGKLINKKVHIEK